jgi:hypothetical protein
MRIEIDMNKVQEDTLVELILTLENAIPGCHVKSQEVYVLECNDAKATAILQSLFGGNSHQAVETVEKKKETKKPGRGKYTRQSLIKILSGPRAGEKITGKALDKILRDHLLEPKTHIRHPQRGEMVIVADVNPDVPYFPIPAGAAEAAESQVPA